MVKKSHKKTQRKQDIDPVAILIALLIFGPSVLYKSYIKPNLGVITYYGQWGLLIIGVILLILVAYWMYKKNEKKKVEIKRIADFPNFLLELENTIKTFKPMRQYKEEKLYQAELVGYLKHNYPGIKIEETRDYSRPDIIIDDIAIEIKGPTDMAGLKTLPDKINTYLPRWDYLFIVLFNIVLSDDSTKNMETYSRKKDGRIQE